MDSRLAAYIAVLPPQPRQGLADSPDGRFWPEASFWQQMRAGRLVSRLGVLLGTHAFEVALVFASWAFLDRARSAGGWTIAWLAAWALCLASTVPLRAASRWLEGVVAVGFGGLLKQRLMSRVRTFYT